MRFLKITRKKENEKKLENGMEIANSNQPTTGETKNKIMEEQKQTQTDPQGTDQKVKVYNLIILDQSGSMITIYAPALAGVNETLQTIRMTKEDHPEQEHYVSLIAFDGVPQTGLRYSVIYDGTPAEKVTDITKEQYRPYGNTPLFDAMGRAINELRDKAKDNDVVLVTIITDGYENASREYTGLAIKALVEEMRKKGWVFTYIGANQDVEKVAESMSINNRMAFNADMAGTKAMFEKERISRGKFFSKIVDRKSYSREDFEKDYFEN